MNGRHTKMELPGSAPIPRALLSLGLPTMVGMLINAFYNLVDTYFVGGLGTDQMGASGNGFSFLLFGFYTVYSFLFLVMGEAKEG